MFLSKPFQILNPKSEIYFQDISFTWIGSTKLSTDLLVLQPEKNLEYIYRTYIQERGFLKTVSRHLSALINPILDWKPLFFSKWFSPMWLLLSITRQNLMQAFWTVCNLFFSDIDRFGYQAEHAKSKCGCIRELHNILLRGYDRYLLCL